MPKAKRIMNIDDEMKLLQLRKSARAAFLDWASLDKRSKAAKKKSESADAEVFKFIDELTDPTGKLPFDHGDDDDDEGEEVEQDDASTQTTPPIDDAPAQEESPSAAAASVAPGTDGDAYDVASDEDRWKFVQIDLLRDYGAKPGDVAKLNEAGIKTLGDVVNWTKDGEKRLTDIKGIGETANDRIIDALVAYHEANPANAPQSPSDASEGGNVQTDGPNAEGPAEGQPGALNEKPSVRRRKKADPEPESAPEDDGQTEPTDHFDPPTGEFDPDSDSQRNDHDDA